MQQDITYRVPQGFILGLFVSIVYINDLPFCVNKCKKILFADDITIYMVGKQINNIYIYIYIYEDMNKELTILADWFSANKLSLNVSKSKCMLFCRSHSPRMKNFLSNIVIQRKIILGLLKDARLDWQEHINSCKHKLTSALYAINRVNNFLPVSAFKTIYYTVVYPT